MPIGFAVVGHGRGLDIPGVLLADVVPVVGLVDVVPLEGLLEAVEVDVPDPVADVPGVVVELVAGFVEVEVVPEGEVLELADGLVPGNGSHGMVPFGVICGTGVAVLAGGVAVCGVGEAVFAGGVAVCGVGEDVCAGGVAVCEPEVEVCRLLAPAVKADKAIVPSSAEIFNFMEASKID